MSLNQIKSSLAKKLGKSKNEIYSLLKKYGLIQISKSVNFNLGICNLWQFYFLKIPCNTNSIEIV